jgi:LPS-assembly lipoprotein
MTTRRQFLVLGLGLPALLAGCGWEPLYANHDTEAADADLQAIKILPIRERIGQRLETGLRNSFNPSDQSGPQLYALGVALSTSLGDSGIQSQGLGTRGEVGVSATYRLTDLKTNALLQTNTIHTIESFDIQANGYSTVVAQDDALTRSIEEIRREIVARLTLFLQHRKTTGAS